MPSSPDQLLRKFRGNQRASLPIHPLEKALAWVVALNACSLPWMLGGMRPWAQLASLSLSVIAFSLSLIPRHFAGNYTRAESYTYYPHRKLLRWPIWWISVLFFGCILIQALNPSYEFVQRETTWAMRSIPNHITWLPSGMKTPFNMMNPWRQMLIWAAPFLLACALWVGFSRRKTLVTLLTAIVINATVLGLTGIAARFTAPDKILWLTDGIPNYAFASFIYKNHAGSFFALSASLTLSLAVYARQRAARRQLRSSPASLLVFGSMILFVAVLLSYSRAAIIILAGFLIIMTIVGFGRLIYSGGFARAPLAIGIFALGVVLFGLIGGKLVNSEKTLDRISRLTDTEKSDRSVLSRQMAWDAGVDMALEHPVVGWGAGGFRFLFPKYQSKHPEITFVGWRPPPNNYLFWEHAHNDYLQLLIETGWSGVGMCFFAGLLAFMSFVRNRGLLHLPALGLAGACGVTLAHAIVDFPLQNPAILTTLAITAISALIFPTQEPR